MEPTDIGSLGDPPDDIDRLDLPLVTWDRPIVRIHDRTREPLFFGRAGRNRFDDPRGEFGVLYAAADLHGAFIETFGASSARLVTRTAIAARAAATIALERPLTLVDLRGAGLVRLGADARIFAADRAPARRWSLALWRHPRGADGLCYPARHDPSRVAIAVFDRASEFVSVSHAMALGSTHASAPLAAVLEHYGFGLLEA